MNIEPNTKNHPTLGIPCEYTIPTNINELSLREAAEFYARELHLAVHPLNPSDKGDTNGRGKKPLLKGWPDHKLDDVTEAFLDEHFHGGSNNNIGVVLAEPQVVVDLDSKRDDGASVMQWLDAHPELAGVPRERTGGGLHLHFICDDIPPEVLSLKQSLPSKLNDTTNAELFFAGLNVVTSPSVHPSGRKYQWQLDGTIPRIKWADLCRIFGFTAPEPKKKGRPRKEKPWWGKYPGDIKSLDLVAVAEKLGLLGKCLDEKKPKQPIRCPWDEEHSDGHVPSSPQGDTVIFNPANKVPAFKCLHAHCAHRGLEQLLEYAESKIPGIVAAHCTRLRAWEPGSTDNSGRPQLVLPGKGQPTRAFSKDLGKQVAESTEIFRHVNRVVEVVTNTSKSLPSCNLSALTPAQFVTAIEAYVEVGYLIEDENGDSCFVARSMDEKTARIILASRAFRDQLPEIRRVLNVPIPMIDAEGEIVMPEPGYDERFLTWLDPGAPVIKPMSLADATAILADLFSGHKEGGFWWKDEEARNLALARLLTAFCRGLIDFKRTPVWAFVGNRPGVGKDTLANLAIVLFLGHPLTGAPLSKDNDEEMRKRISTTVDAAAQFFHLANVKGELNYPSLEAATDASGVWEDRLLGTNTLILKPNEVDYSFSANNATWTPDFQRRLRVIELHCGIEDLGGHQYRHQDFLGLVLENRSPILSALNACVVHWASKGRPGGPTPFSSFPVWGRVVGGIMTACGFLDPCRPQVVDIVGGDQSTQDMTELFRLAHEAFGEVHIRKDQFQEFIRNNSEIHELFGVYDFTNAGGLSVFGRRLLGFRDRTLAGITFSYHPTSKNHGTYRFTRSDVDSSPLSPSSPSEDAFDGGFGGDEGYKGLPTAGPVELNKSLPKNKNAQDISTIATTSGSLIPRVPRVPQIQQRSCRTDDDLKAMAGDLLLATEISASLRFPAAKKPSTPATSADPKGLTLQKPGGTIWRVDLHALKGEPNLGKILRWILISRTIVAYDAGIILEWCINHFGMRPSKVCCISTADRLLSNGDGEACDSLKSCLQRYLPAGQGGDSMPTRPTLMTPVDRLKRRTGDSPASLHELAAATAAEIEKNGLSATWKLENDVLLAVTQMKANGMHVDRALMQEIASEGNPQANYLLQYIHPKTSRIHSNFDPLGAVTGRISSREPNLQNLQNTTRGTLRVAFTAPEGFCLVGGDYSNIDVRVLAAEAGDEAMIADFKKGVDIYRKSAAVIYSKSQDAVTSEERKVAKLLLLGQINGQDTSGMIHSASKSGLELKEATALRFREMIMDDHPGIWSRYQHCFRAARKRVTEIRTRLGRRRLVSKDIDDTELRNQLLNTPIQGGTADGMKRAMVLLLQRLPAEARLVLNVHDELIVECPVGMAEEVKVILTKAMIEGMQSIYPEVRIEVEAGIWRTWADKGTDFRVP